MTARFPVYCSCSTRKWKPSYCPPQTSEIQEIQTCSSSTQAQICAESAESAERETEENEIEKHSSQEHNNTLVSSSYVPSSQKRHVVLVDQPLKGLVPEELCSSSSETSQIRGSSKESYSILQERSSPGGNAPDVSIVASSQNSHEFEIEQPLSHVTSERTQFHCSLSESQLGKLFVSSVSFDEVTSPPCISDGLLPMQEGFTQIKPRYACQRESICNDNTPVKRKSLAESSNSTNTVVSQSCLVSNHNLSVKKIPLGNQSNHRNMTYQENVLKNFGKEVAVSSPFKGNVGHSSTRKEMLEKAKADFDVLFIQNTWNHKSQTPVQEFTAYLFEIDRRLSTKRKRSQTDDSVQKTHSSVGVRQGNKLLLTDSPVSPADIMVGGGVEQTLFYIKDNMFLETADTRRDMRSKTCFRDMFWRHDAGTCHVAGTYNVAGTCHCCRYMPLLQQPLLIYMGSSPADSSPDEGPFSSIMSLL
ncbi:uncharacterized protein LOC144648353 [Oculina patagonica]